MSITYAQPIVAENLSGLEYFAWKITRGMGFVALAISVLFGIALLSQPVMAEPAAVHRSELVELLGEKYAEVPIAIGLTDRGAMVEVLTTNDGSTWTIILTLPTGKSRVLGAGEAWISVTSLVGPDV